MASTLRPASTRGHRGGFRILAIANSAAVDMGRRYLFKICLRFFWVTAPGVGLLDHVGSCVIF